VLSFFSFVSSLIQAQRLGAEIGPTLRAQAEQMRYQRMILAEERVNKLPVKLLVPLVFFIFPSISVLLIGPAILQVQQNFPTVTEERIVVDAEKETDLSKGILGNNNNLDSPEKTSELNKSIILRKAPPVAENIDGAQPVKDKKKSEKAIFRAPPDAKGDKINK
jgi:hypothetical protein